MIVNTFNTYQLAMQVNNLLPPLGRSFTPLRSVQDASAKEIMGGMRRGVLKNNINL